MCFPECDSTLRNDQSFQNRVHEGHHINYGEAVSPFERLPNIVMVLSFPLDYNAYVVNWSDKKTNFIVAFRGFDV